MPAGSVTWRGVASREASSRQQRRRHQRASHDGAGVSGAPATMEDARDPLGKEERGVRMQQRPQQTSESAAAATDRASMSSQRTAQERRGPSRAVPDSLRMGSAAVAVAAAVDPLYTTPFLQLALREASEREVAWRMLRSSQKMSSSLHTVRVDGLTEATEQLLQWTMQAAVEAAERQHAPHARGLGVWAELIRSHPLLPPYDAVRAEVLGGTPSSAAHGYDYQHSSAETAAAGAAAAAAHAGAVRSSSLDVVQRALEGVDYTRLLFNTILLPRQEVRHAMNTGHPISTQLSGDTALKWTTLPPTSQRVVSTPAGDSAPGAQPSQSSNELLHAATAVTYEEQELALRYIQGTCLLLYYQRRCCSDGCFVYYATDLFQCMRSHADALFTSQRRELEERDAAREQTRHPAQRGDGWGSYNTNTNSSSSGGGGGGGERASFATAARHDASRSQVAVDPALVRVLVALVDAVEAACHYNPPSLRLLAQTGGVTAMLNLAYCPFMPTPIRAAVLNTISVLLQEVTPLRRYVEAASKALESGGGPGGPTVSSADPVLQRMLENAVHDNPVSSEGRQLPFTVDFSSASKFGLAVRNWFLAHGLGSLFLSVAQLHDLRTTFHPGAFVVRHDPSAAAKGSTALAVGAGGGGGGGSSSGGGVGSSVTAPGGMSVMGMGPVSSVMNGATTATANPTAASAASASHATALRCGELYRQRLERLLECMDGRQLR
ncbi:hypothetical protein NESM_000703000 [Novymonas esmeraldas]|uniref:Uncharacterized protein n=1 Tax=Novymonas esmeraldas TaxID=1808958 RepID=A0AAW0EWS1_9TRYP